MITVTWRTVSLPDDKSRETEGETYEYSVMVKAADLDPEALATATKDELSKAD